MMDRPIAILFDFDDTILGNRRYDPEAGNARLLDHAIPCTDPQILDTLYPKDLI